MADTINLVRPVAAGDIDGVMVLLRLRHEEFGLGRYDERRAAEAVQSAIDGSGPILAGVICGDAAPEATIGLALAKWWDEADYHLEVLWDYVHPDCRDKAHARKLRRFAEMSADTIGTPLIAGGPIRAGSEGKVHAYCKHYRPVGAFFLYGGAGAKWWPTKRRREGVAASLIKAFVGEKV